jgi:hypothetical protein
MPPLLSECRPALSPEALSHLTEQGWQQRPLVIKKAFPADFLTEQDTFDAWRTFTKGLPPARWGNLARLYQGSELITSVEPFLPTASDTSWDSYLKRLSDQTGFPDWGLCLTDPQLSNTKIFRRLLIFLDSLYGYIGMPCGGCSPDLFMMNHKASFFRLHKDAQDVFTFVISGWRRFLLWPFETFSTIAGMEAHESRKPHLLTEVDHEVYRSQATVVEGTAGDLLYWPAEWWHVGESNGERAVTLGVGTVHEANPMQKISAAADRLRKCRRDRQENLRWSALEGAEPTITAYIDWMQSLLADEGLWAETRRDLLSWTTRCGLNRVPPPLRRSAPLDEARWLVVTSPSTIAFDENGEEDSLFCSIAGHDLTLTPGAPAKALLAILSRGGIHRVEAVIDEALETSRSAWNREQLRRLLEKIEENYGFELLDGPSDTDVR